jgi:divalent metal cation (Fe/Co/Zn/Cd) transporter
VSTPAHGATPAGLRLAAARRARRLEVLTIAWNAVEFVLTVGLGVAAGSLALMAFGFDSVAEILASGAVLWTLQGELDVRRQRIALRLVACAFFLLASALAAGAIYNLVTAHRPDTSIPGIVYLAMAAVVMYGLARAKQRAELVNVNHPLVHEARVTLLDAGLATSVLLALLVNAAFDWWWADAVATLVVAAVAVVEGALAPKEHRSDQPVS